jgi:tellurite resistance-related uncharacterized protein
MKSLPDSLTHYKSTPEFNADSVPAGLLKSHRTAENVWGRIRIIEGSLRYHILEPEPETLLLTPDRHGVVEPGIQHQVEPIGPVRFCVDFLR